MMLSLRSLATATLVSIALAQTNLPDVPAGVFEANGRVTIDAPIDKVWAAVIDFSSYPNWNPFVRQATFANNAFFPLPEDEQTIAENKRVIFNTQIPPLPQPVNASTPPNVLNAQITFENITHLQPELYRVAWRQLSYPEALVDAERWSAVSTVEGKTLYESREVYNGGLAGTIGTLYGDSLNEAFQAQADALKVLVESQ